MVTRVGFEDDELFQTVKKGFLDLVTIDVSGLRRVDQYVAQK